MPRRKSNLGRRTEGSRRRLSNMTEEERASVGERNRLSTILTRDVDQAERRAARLEDARLRARQSRSGATNLVSLLPHRKDLQIRSTLDNHASKSELKTILNFGRLKNATYQARVQSSEKKIDLLSPQYREIRFVSEFIRSSVIRGGGRNGRAFITGQRAIHAHPSEPPRGETTFADDTTRDRLQIPTSAFVVCFENSPVRSFAKQATLDIA
ncbi:unnamed protein product [Larinioides sclopetarius]|uniref:Uncharacterized protein n=1 Tax=Larinioides sclopetarius TaxID=280406 RepID=A0AAV2ACV0_9ARAC